MATVKPVPTQDNRPSRAEAEKAVETLIRWTGDDTARPGLVDTPARVVRAFEEYFSGYHDDIAAILSRTFEDLTGYDDFVLVRNIDFVSHCEHHIAPIIGVAHVAYWPGEHVTGLSKLSRIVDTFAKRLSSQETMTRGIADALNTHLQPKGVAVVIDALHSCMSNRGTHKRNASTVTSVFTGVFEDDRDTRARLLDMIRGL